MTFKIIDSHVNKMLEIILGISEITDFNSISSQSVDNIKITLIYRYLVSIRNDEIKNKFGDIDKKYFKQLITLSFYKMKIDYYNDQ